MHPVYQSTYDYFPRLFRQIYLYLVMVMMGSLVIMPLQAKSKSKDSIDDPQETAQALNSGRKAKAVKTSSKRKPKSMLNPYKRKKANKVLL